MPTPHPITHANARTLAQKRWEKARLASSNRVLAEAAAIDPTVRTPADAIALVTAKHYTLLMDSDKPAVAQVERLGRMLTGMDTQTQAQQAQPAQHNTISGTPEAMAQLLAILERERAAAIAQATATEGHLREADTGTGA